MYKLMLLLAVVEVGLETHWGERSLLPDRRLPIFVRHHNLYR